MEPPLTKAIHRAVSAARRRLFFCAFVVWWVRAATVGFAGMALVVAIDRRWDPGLWGGMAPVVMMGTCTVFAAGLSCWGLGSRLRSALTLDAQADLKARTSSALEFLSLPELSGPQTAQVMDAGAHSKKLSIWKTLHPHLPRYLVALLACALLFGLAFLIPPEGDPLAQAAAEQERLEQAEKMAALTEQLEKEQQDEETAEVIERLKEMAQRLEQGEMDPRDLMVELGRMEKALQQKMEAMGVEKLDGEISQLIPQFMASEASREVGRALKGNQLRQAAEQMEALAEQMRSGQLSQQAKESMALHFKLGASRLGEQEHGSFSSDLAEASKSLSNDDAQNFGRASQSIGQKFQRVGQFRGLQSMRNQLSLAKAGLGQRKGSGSRRAQGEKSFPGEGGGDGSGGKGEGRGKGKGKGTGGLSAGTETAGNPLGDPNRLEESYRQMLAAKGMLGDGPVDSEVSLAEGQLGESDRSLQDLYAEYAEVADQTIEREEIPLSRSLHVKRYFQAIRPAE